MVDDDASRDGRHYALSPHEVTLTKIAVSVWNLPLKVARREGSLSVHQNDVAVVKYT